MEETKKFSEKEVKKLARFHLEERIDIYFQDEQKRLKLKVIVFYESDNHYTFSFKDPRHKGECLMGWYQKSTNTRFHDFL